MVPKTVEPLRISMTDFRVYQFLYFDYFIKLGQNLLVKEKAR